MPQIEILEQIAQTRDMRVRVDESRNNGTSAEVEPPNPRPDLLLRVAADSADAAVANGHAAGYRKPRIERVNDCVFNKELSSQPRGCYHQQG